MDINLNGTMINKIVNRRYELLWNNSECVIQNDSDVMLEKVAVIRDVNENVTYVRCSFRSLTDKPVKSLILDIDACDDQGKELEGLRDYRLQGFVTKRNSVFGQNIPIKLPDNSTGMVDVRIARILFEDGWITVCDKNQGVTKLDFAKHIMAEFNSREIAEEYVRETSDFSKYIPCVGERLWRCSCGAINENEQSTCFKCNIEKQKLLTAYNPEQLRIKSAKYEEEKRAQIIAEQQERARIQRENEERAQRERAEEERIRQEGITARKNKTKKAVSRIIAIAAALVIIAGLSFAAVVYGIPFAKYTMAEKAVQNGDFDKAYDLYSELGEYKDSASKAVETTYAKAENLKEKKQYNDAAEVYNSISNYKDSAVKANECKNEDAYIKAVELYDAKKYGDSAKAFLALGDYSDAKDWLNKSNYAIAKDYFDKKDYEKAYAGFDSLGNYEDSIELANESKYMIAEQAMTDQDYEKAYEYFSELSDYKSSSDKVKETQYKLASDFMTEKKYKEASELFGSSLLSDYKDSKKKSQENAYLYAVECYEAKSFSDAVEYFIKADGYENSVELMADSKYENANLLVRDRDYEKAIQIYQELGDYKECAERLLEAKYGYVLTHRNYSDMDTYDYLKELKSVKYKDSADIMKDLYKWKVTIVGINNSRGNQSNMSSISKYDPVFIHYDITGGEPGAGIKLSFKTQSPDGQPGSFTTSSEQGAGSYCEGWEDGIYSKPWAGKAGILSVKIFDPSGKQMAESTVRITN